MISYSLRARVAKAGPAPAEWSRKIAAVVGAKTGVTPSVLVRIGGGQEILFVSQYENFAAFEKAQAQLVGDADYIALLDTMQSQGLFEAASVDTAFWLPG
ncbi:hypothetical protein [Phenylobacterium sp.]|jgi:hypothetical protein|uniref:hypothetical protein n=1 Tax=Phenylobacterium sp. TaxID=1871053 RepID=UPI0011F7B5B6|nr:hypothetical protein [Phenylobacterium sp.]THD53611.1 MAG: hypothetical protein E8A12_18345 [Phenylobacterium sp.]